MTTPNHRLPDAEVRTRASGDLDVNLAVMAGAGTGKTSLLVERLLALVGTGRVPLERVAAITFTEKAAGEMRERLGDGLETLRALAAGEAAGADEEVGEAHRAFRRLVRQDGLVASLIRDRALAALEALDRTTVTTIHGFCADLLRGWPLEAGVEPGFEVDTGDRFEALFDEEWETWLGAELGPDATRPELWSALLERADLDEVRRAARDLAGFSVSGTLVAGPYAAIEPKAALGATARALRDDIAAFLAEVAGVLSAKPTENLTGAAAALGALADAGPDAAVTIARDAGLLDRRTDPKPNTKLSAEQADRYNDLSRRALRLVRDAARLDETACGRLVEAVRPFAQRLRAALRSRGLLGFDALLVLARDLLRDHPEVRSALRRRYTTILVDEFQDTDPVQYEIVLFLAGRTEDHTSDAFAARLEPGRLFVVGDPKQSIYRFRGADYAAFDRAVARVTAEGGTKLDLVTNFRSVPGLVDAVNRLFVAPSSAWRPSRYQPGYVPIASTGRPEAPQGAVELWTVDTRADAKAEDRRLAEGRALAHGIGVQVAGNGRRYGDILVLLRSFSSIGSYLGPLREAGIPFVVSAARSFFERPEVAHLIAILRAIATPTDPVAVLAYLRSPAGGVPDSELLAHAEAGRRFEAGASTDPRATPAIAAALERLARLRAAAAELPVDACIRFALDASRLGPLEAFAWEGAQRVANLELLTARAAALARDGRMTLGRVLDVLESEVGSPVETDSPLADESGDAVRILTVHTAKGLEAPVVFVADLAHKTPGWRADQAVIRVNRGSGGEHLAVRGRALLNAAELAGRLEDERHDEAERIRLLYVALTRAKERLVLLSPRLASSPSPRDYPWLAALAAWGYDPSTPPDDGERLAGGLVVHRSVPLLSRASTSQRSVPEFARAAVRAYEDALSTVGSAAARGSLRIPSDAAGAPDELEAGLVSEGNLEARAVGTVVHRWLHVHRDREAPGAELVALAREASRAHRVDPATVERDAREILQSFLRSPLADRLRRADVLGRELPFVAAASDGGAWSGRIDLVYRDDDGAVVVADFKTDRGASRLEERYAGQLRVYAEAVGRALGLAAPPRAELWHLRSGRIVEVAPA